MRTKTALTVATMAFGLLVWTDSPVSAGSGSEARTVAGRVDAILERDAKAADVQQSPLVDDIDFLRRVSLDLTGTVPTPAQITLFKLSPRETKRSDLIDKLLQSDSYARNWTAYWRDVIYRRATNMRAPISRPTFEKWMNEQFSENTSWDSIVTELLTASGHVQSNGATGMIFAHEGQPEEIAAEASRIFLGIQIQCANCHDHPWDDWKREQFHELTAYFPRINLRRERTDGKQVADWYVESFDRERSQRRKPSEFLLKRLDRNRDGLLTKAELGRMPRGGERLTKNFDRLLSYADKNSDGKLSIKEFATAERPTNDNPGRGNTEHYMPDLSDPASKGTLIQPAFFATGSKSRRGLNDADRRDELASLMTSKSNPWFSRAFVNRMWAQLLGEGFYTPIDDMGPARSAQHEEAMEVLAGEFSQSGYDIKWLLRTITNTRAYQRQLRTEDDRVDGDAFAATSPMRLRGDQVYDALTSVLGGGQGRAGRRRSGGSMMMSSRGYGRRSPRNQMNSLFGFDPSTPQEDLKGSIPQALFMMNSSLLRTATQAEGFTKLAQILRQHRSDEKALTALYLLVLGREPGENEVGICIEHIGNADSRGAGFEDVMWSLLNSAEFVSRR
ncbi:MAG: DUF1549 domain-containing protein [Planctomycetaceae bacterium]